ncbi:hypothetical protein C9374_007787 [Naegleria lovaniensis]|uniref:protein-tyrosine-phosphatase n=1 Tax=Naegleria lovaniensis TaxID=51637 RepID=A0AA88GGT8_NAELO|nr:uncharacterized protein C9374_007787 [Naegleria lovaniensis]KAG2379149.1 hypothetical protein C9374_007787 [Naegleria lovaniensis]
MKSAQSSSTSVDEELFDRNQLANIPSRSVAPISIQQQQQPPINLHNTTNNNNITVMNHLNQLQQQSKASPLSPSRRNLQPQLFVSDSLNNDNDLAEFETKQHSVSTSTKQATFSLPSKIVSPSNFDQATANICNHPMTAENIAYGPTITKSPTHAINTQHISYNQQPPFRDDISETYNVHTISDSTASIASSQGETFSFFESSLITSPDTIALEGKNLNDDLLMRQVTFPLDREVICSIQSQMHSALHGYVLEKTKPIEEKEMHTSPQCLRLLTNIRELNLSDNHLYRFPFNLLFLSLPPLLAPFAHHQIPNRKPCDNIYVLPNITKLDISRNTLKVSRIESIIKKQKNFEKTLEKERRDYLRSENASPQRKVSLSLFKNSQEQKDSNNPSQDDEHKTYRYDSLRELKMSFNQLKIYPLFVHTFFPKLQKLDLSFNHLNSESIEVSEKRNSNSLQTMFEKDKNDSSNRGLGIKKKLNFFSRKTQHTHNADTSSLPASAPVDMPENSPTTLNDPHAWSPNQSTSPDEKIFSLKHSNPYNTNVRYFEAGVADPSLSDLDLSSNLFKTFPLTLKLRNLRILKLNKNVQMNPMADKSAVHHQDVSKKEFKSMLSEHAEKGFDFEADLQRVCRDNLPNLEHVEMIDCKLVTFPSNVISIESLRTFIFDRNPFGAGSVQHRNQQIVQKVIMLSKNEKEKFTEDQEIDDSLLRGFPDLFHLRNKFNITRLSVNHCRLNLDQDLPRILKTLPKLKSLKAGNNLIKGKIDTSNFEVFHNIEDLDLSNNFLQGFNFKVFPNLKILNLENNKIQEDLVWVPSTLTYFNVQNNMFSGDLEKVLVLGEQNSISQHSYCQNLEELIVSSNNFTSIPFIDCFPTLRTYKVSNNARSISQFPLSTNSTIDLHHLETVEIANHGIMEIPASFFTRCPNITYLDLSSNFIRKIPDEMGKASKITHLFLKYNEIVDLDDNVIMKLTSLKHLEAKQNSKQLSEHIETETPLRKWLLEKQVDISENSFKVPDMVEENLYLGCKQASSHYSTIKNLGITHILTIASEFNPRFHDRSYDKVPDIGSDENSYIETSHTFVTKHVKMKETQNTDLIGTFNECLPFIEESLDQSKGKRKLLIHCHVGINRSASIVIMYLMKKNSWTLSESLKYVREKRSLVMPMPEFVKQLKQYNIALKKERKQLQIGTSSNQPNLSSNVGSPLLDNEETLE